MSICCLDFGGLHVYLQHTTPGYYLHLNCLQTVFINSLFLTTSHLYTTVTLTWDIFQLGFRCIQENRRIIYLLGFIYFNNQIFTGRNPRLEDWETYYYNTTLFSFHYLLVTPGISLKLDLYMSVFIWISYATKDDELESSTFPHENQLTQLYIYDAQEQEISHTFFSPYCCNFNYY